VFIIRHLEALGEAIGRACRVIAMHSFDGLVGAIRGLEQGYSEGRKAGRGDASDILELYSYELFMNVPGVKPLPQFSPISPQISSQTRPIAPDIFPKRDISTLKQVCFPEKIYRKISQK
jgi:hypothetical protein